MEDSAEMPNEKIEAGLNKLKDTLSQLELKTPSCNNCNSDAEFAEEEDQEINKLSHLKKRRNMADLDKSQILSSRLRSSSGRVYSNSIVIENTATTPKSLAPLGELEDEDFGEREELEYRLNNVKDSDMGRDCLNGDCCKNTSKIVNMISKLQETVEDIQKNTRQQIRINSNTSSDIRRLDEKSGKNKKEIAQLRQELTDYKFQLRLVENVVIWQDEQIAALNRKITEAQQREMYPNLVISGIIEEPNENPIMKYNEFVKDQLEIQELIPAHRAYRVGAGQDRPLIVELRDPITHKGKIYSKVSKLKGKANSKGGRFFISDHLPEELNENRRRTNELFSENKKKNEKEKLKMSISKGRLLIEDKPYTKAISPPKPNDIFNPSDNLLDLADEIDMVKGKEEKEGKCQFVAYAAVVKDHEDIKAAYTKVRMKYAYATHVVCAYRLQGKHTPNLQDYSDDGEFGAGRTILSELKTKQISNIVVFMIRIFGGKHLGPKRYNIFRKVANSAIEALQEKMAKYRAEQKAEEERLQQQRDAPPEHTGWTDDENESDTGEDWSKDKKEI